MLSTIDDKCNNSDTIDEFQYIHESKGGSSEDDCEIHDEYNVNESNKWQVWQQYHVWHTNDT